MERCLLVLSVVCMLALLSVAGVHPPNQNKLCSRAGCGHYRYSHDGGNGPCLYADPNIPAGHCERFLK